MNNASNPMVQPGYDMNAAMRAQPRTTEPRQQGTPGIDDVQQTSAPGFTIHPPGVPSSMNEFNYEPQSNGGWQMYPPGVQAPTGAFQASMPQAATGSDLMRMQHEMSNIMGSTKSGV